MDAIYSILLMLENIGYDRLSEGLSAFNPGMFNAVVRVANVVIMPIALSMLTLFALLEVLKIQEQAGGETTVMHKLLLPFFIKFVLSYAVVTQAVGFLSGIFNLVLSIIQNIALEIGLGSEILDTDATREAVSELGFGSQLHMWLIIIVIMLIVIIASFFINIKITMRMIEIYVFIAFSPLPLSTFGSGVSSQMAQNFLKGFVAVCVQGAVMLFYLSLATAGFATMGLMPDQSITGQMWSMAGFMILLIFAIMASESTAKKVIGAM